MCIKIIDHLKNNDLKTGYLYFYVHFVLEVVCLFYLSRITNNSNYIWLVPIIYDALAFVPQSIVGYISDKYPKINMGIIGTILLLIAYLIYGLTNISIFISLIVLCIGNAILHVAGAEATLRTSNGKLSTSAIFVSGGSFGIITGRLLAKTSINPLLLIILILTIIPFVLISNKQIEKNNSVDKFNYVKDSINSNLVIIIAVLVVIVRGYMGYGIPTSWNKTVIQTVMLFSAMGIGKALGGVLSDIVGVRKTAIMSTLLAVPFLCFGDNIMIVSLIGLMFFSMTMSITLGILVSKLKDIPGLAFGLTTIGLFLGSVPAFFIKFNTITNIIMIIVMSVLCTFALGYVLNEDKK